MRARIACVVRLKSGDPLLFGRAAEEMAALRRPALPFEVVPGVSAAFAAAAAIGCSLTDREWASKVIFSTGHHAQSHNRAALPALEDATRVVYMPGRDLQLLAEEWLLEGLPADLPCAVVSRAAQPGQGVVHTTLGALGETELRPRPACCLRDGRCGRPRRRSGRRRRPHWCADGHMGCWSRHNLAAHRGTPPPPCKGSVRKFGGFIELRKVSRARI